MIIYLISLLCILLLCCWFFFVNQYNLITESFNGCYSCIYDKNTTNNTNASNENNTISENGCYSSECTTTSYSDLEKCNQFCAGSQEQSEWEKKYFREYDPTLSGYNYYIPATDRKHMYIENDFPYDNFKITGSDSDKREILTINNAFYNNTYYPFTEYDYSTCEKKESIIPYYQLSSDEYDFIE